jgi:HEAT repeat protein
MESALTLEKFLRNLGDEGQPLTYSGLAGLSDMSLTEMSMFEKVWSSVSAARKLDVVGRLVEIADANPQMDFCAVFKLAAKDPNDAVCEKAIYGFWEVEDRSIIPLLLDVLQSSGLLQARAAAATALGKFASLAQDGKILVKDGQMVQDVLMVVLRDKWNPIDVRRRALEAVSPFNTPDIREYVRWAYDSDDVDLQCSSLYAMGKTQDSVWLPEIIDALEGSSAPVRYEAASACGELAEEDAIPHLTPLLDDDDIEVQMAAIDAMGKIGGPLAKQGLLHCVHSGDAALKEAAESALEEMEP